MSQLIALVDCNNFYVSCERLFRPDLSNKPVIVLSNNDGCVVSRSKEVKDLGIKMAVPVFKVQDIVKQHNITLFSSNYSLYADISARVMSTLEEFTPHLEIYSIDEAFLDLTGICEKDSNKYGQQIKKTVLRTTGIPVCVGMGPNKTLAKLANFAAKKWAKTAGVLDLSNTQRREKLLRIVPVGEIWGIGSRTAQKLNQINIHSAWDLASQSPDRIQGLFNIVVARTVLELNGVSCIDLDLSPANKQQIVCSRSFSRRLTDLTTLSQALAEFCSRAAEKLRQQDSATQCISIFIRTSPFNPQEPQYQRSASIHLTQATQDTRIIINKAQQLLKEVFKAGYNYQKCGVQLSHIQSATTHHQIDLFSFQANELIIENTALMAVMDNINRRFPKKMAIASTSFDKSWKPKAELISPNYTTNWQDLLKVK